MSEILQARLRPPLDKWDADDELVEVCRIALWAGSDASDDSLGTFTSLLVALFAAEDAASRWFQAEAAARNIELDAVLGSRGLRIEQLPSFVASARSGALPESNKGVWTQSARYLFRRAVKIRAEVARAASGSNPLLGVRHLLAAYLLESPPGHVTQLVAWQIASETLQSWQFPFLNFIRSHYPEESEGWRSLVGNWPAEVLTSPDEQLASAPRHEGLEKEASPAVDAALTDREREIEAIPATGLIELQWTPAALRVLRAALSLCRQARNKPALPIPEATTHVRSGVLNTTSLIFAIVVVAGGATGDESDDVQFLYQKISAAPGNTEIHLRAYHGFAGQTESSALHLSEWKEDELPLVSRGLNDLLFEASQLARSASGSDVIAVRHLLAALIIRAGSDVWLSLELEPRGLARELFAWITLRWPGDDSVAWSAALLGSAPSRLVPGFAGDAAQGRDSLGVRRDAQSFARVIAAWEVEPPLSIGIFGHWGSGKSFFMKLIQQEIDDLIRAEGPSPQRNFPFCRHVVQVSFNAWHYVEANLWASLVDHILRELRSRLRAGSGNADALTAKLATAKELSAKAKHALEQAEADLAVAKGELANKVAAETKQGLSLRDFLSRDAWADFPLSDVPPDISAEAARVAEKLGLKRALASSRDLAREMTKLRESGGEWRAYWRFVWRGNRGLVTASIVALSVLLVAFAVSQLSVSEWPVWRRVSQATAALGVFLGSAAMWLRWMLRKTEPVLRGVRSVTDWIEAKRRASYAAEQARVEELKVEVNLARRRVDEAAGRVVQAERDVAESTSPRRLVRFIEERLESGDYERHLGIVATIRRDFESLSVLLREVSLAHRRSESDSAEPAAPGEIEPIDRIVLYIDDLDRCPPRRVVEVLEAIHLLLAFPLFVVVVGVDMRWVAQSLRQHHPHLLGGDAPLRLDADKESRDHARNEPGTTPRPHRPIDPYEALKTATAMDYLEKIFQIPFWLGPMTETGGQALIRSMIGAEPERIANRIRARAPGLASAASAPSQSLSTPSTRAARAPLSEGTEDRSATPTADALEVSNARTPSVDPGAIAGSAAALRLEDGERQFMLRMAKVVSGSPRRLKRFVNSYRILRAGCSPAELERFRTAHDPPHRAIMTLLAIATAAPRASGFVFRLLADATDDDELAAFSGRMDGGCDDEFARVKLAISVYGWDGTPNTIRELRHWGDRVARFTFREGGW